MRTVDGVRRGASRATRRHRGHRRGVFAVTNVDYIIVLSVLFTRRDLRFHSLSHRGRLDTLVLRTCPGSDDTGC
jgi:hypothetical protein